MTNANQADPPAHDARAQHRDAIEALGITASSSASSSQLAPPSESEKRNGLDATSLAKWNKLAERGGIGKAVALEDYMASRKGDLMFLAGDEITVLRALTEDIFLGFCEGVIGRFYRQHVRLPPGLATSVPLNSSTAMSPDPLSTSSSTDDSFHSLPLQASSTSNSVAQGNVAELPGVAGAAVQEAQTSQDSVGGENGVTATLDNVQRSTASSQTDPPDEPQHDTGSSLESSTDGPRQETSDKRQSSTSSISSTWSNHSNLEIQSEDHLTSAESVAVALRGFATGAKVLNNEEESEFGRRYHSRDSSLHGSIISWSSARESDEVSEGSIRYPTTVSLIDRMKAMRMPASYQNTDPASPGNESPPIIVEGAESPLMRNMDRSSQRASVGMMAKATLLPISPPARPEKNRLRPQQPEETTQSPSSAAATPEKDDSADISVNFENRGEAARKETTVRLSNEKVQHGELEFQKDAMAETLSVMTGESNPFEFGTGVSASSTPNEVLVQAPTQVASDLPVPLPPSDSRTDAVNGTNHTDFTASSAPIQGHKAASSSLGVIRELANRFSTASDIMRKHHVDDVGVQSYFPVVADEKSPPLGQDCADVFGTTSTSEPQHAQNFNMGDSASQIAEPPLKDIAAESESSNPVVLGNTISVAPMPITPEELGSMSAGHQSADEWNILDDYVKGFTSPGPHSPEAVRSPPKSISVLSDVTSSVNSKPANESPGMVKKKVSGILKIRTAVSSPRTQQNENSPKLVRTPTDATFQHGSPEASMSPDTKRFRAFAMHSASPTVTPTKPGSRVQPRSISSAFGSKSAEATKLVQDDTLHGQLAMDLASARNPVPISFLLGQSSGSPQMESSPQSSSTSTLNGTPRQYRSTASPSPVYGKHSPKAPSSPFFPSSSDKPRSRSFSSIEVPLPMHRSESSDSLQVAYAGILQNGQIPERQVKERHEPKARRSLSRSGTGKLSALRRKLSLKGGDLRPDMAAMLAENQPPLPDTPSMRSLSKGRESQQVTPGSARTEGTGTEKESKGPAFPATSVPVDGQPETARTTEPTHDLPPISDTHGTPVREAVKATPTEGSSPNDLVGSEPPQSPSVPLYDQYGYTASLSPVPISFNTTRSPEKEVRKLEQTLLALTEQTPTASSSKKVKMLVENQLPPSVRGRVWKWLLAAPSIPHQQYQNYIDSFDIPQLEIDPSLLRRFGDHRAFMHGFQSVQQMMFLFITRHQNAPPPPDTIWIASVFLTQSFHEADAYVLFESFLERVKECWSGQQLRSWAQTLQEIIQAHDPALAKHLALCPDLYHTLMRRWTFTMFAEAIPLPTCLRALDLIIVQGTSTILKLAAVIILLCSKRLQALANPTDIALFLSQPTQEWLTPDTVFKNMGKIALPKRGFSIGKLGSPRM